MNRLNPYALESNENGYNFYTDNNCTYHIYFNQGTNYFYSNKGLNNITFDFGFWCDHEVNDHIYDSRIEQTLMQCLILFFQSNPEAILSYVCEGGDSLELLRFRLFKIWFIRHLSDKCNRLDFQAKMTENSWFCGSMIFHSSNSQKEEIKNCFAKDFEQEPSAEVLYQGGA